MKTCKQVTRRALALLLSLLIVATNIGVLPIFAAEVEDGQPHEHGAQPQTNVWTGTSGSLVAGNYELNDYEKDILVCTGLIGDTYSVEIPMNNDDGLVSIDADTQTVTAKPYEANGFVWVPSAAVVKYTAANGSAGADIDVTLKKVGENYVGNFTKPANSYRVEVTYSLYIAVDAALQQALLNASYYLVNGYKQVDTAITGSLALVASELNDKMEDLRQIANGSTVNFEYNGQVVYTYTTPALSNITVKNALNDLLADYDANGGNLTLNKFCKDYQTAASKVQFMIEKGEAFKDHIAWFYGRINAIGNDDGCAELQAYVDSLPGSVATAVDEAVQKIIEKAVDKAISLGVDFTSLKGKTRNTTPSIYEEIESKRPVVEQAASDYEALAGFYEMLGNTAKAEEYRKQAADVRTQGNEALDTLKLAIETVYTEGDKAVVEAETKAAEAKQVVDMLPSVVSKVGSINSQTWEFIGKELVKASATADEYKALDKAVIAAAKSEETFVLHNDVEIKAELFAAETVISAMVDQYSVFVDVKANVIGKNAVDIAETVSLSVFSTDFPMDKGTAAADVLAAIDATGIEASALNAWDSYYAVGATYYDRVVTVTNAGGEEVALGDLTGDIHYTITYAPKTYAITMNCEDGSVVTNKVPYGYNWRLPRPADLTKSYEYKVDGVARRENTIIRIVKDIDVVRTEGKVIAPQSLYDVIIKSLVPGGSMSQKEKDVLTSGALLVNEISFRTPDSNDKLTAIVAEGEGFKLTAQPMHAGMLNSDATWVPVSATLVTMTRAAAPSYTLNKVGEAYEVYFETNEVFSGMQVTYQLQITGQDAALISDLVNLGNTLVGDTAQQKGALDELCNENNFYTNLGKVNYTLLSTVTGVVQLTAPAKAALEEMTSLAINLDTGLTYLYEYLTQYMSENGGLSYYYKGDNAKKIAEQIALVNKNLPIIWNDAPVQKYLADMGMTGQGKMVEDVLAQLKSTYIKPVNALVNTNSAFIDNLLAIVTGAGTTTDHGSVPGTIVLEETLTATAPGLTSYVVQINTLKKDGSVSGTYKLEKLDYIGETITAAELQAMYDALLATIPNTQYYDGSFNPTDITLTEDETVVTGTLNPITYTVKIDGEADQILYAFDAYTITLPGTGNNGLKYIYSFGGNTVEVGSGAQENFALGTSIEAIDALFGADRELVITREEYDINKAELLIFIDKLNLMLSNAGLVSGNNASVVFIPMTDAVGNLAVVLRINSAVGSPNAAALMSDMMDLIMDLSYVGLNGSPMFGVNTDGELKLYLQSIINLLLNSGLGLDSLAAMIEADGNIKEMTLPGMTAMNATGNSIVLSNGKVINAVDALGGLLVTSDMQYGINATNCTSVPLYITYQDFDSQKSLLAKVKKGADQLIPYVNVNMKDGALNTYVNFPDTAYAYMLTAMLSLGQVNFDNLQSYDLNAVMQYAFSLISPFYKDNNISADSFFNTLKKTGFYDLFGRFDLESHKALMNFVYNGVDFVYDHVSQTGYSVGNKYSGVLHYDAMDVILNKVGGSLSDLTNMIAEKETGVDLPITYTLENLDGRYEAMVLDIRGNGILNKYTISPDGASVLAKASDDAIVTLVGDIYGDVVVNNDVMLNLNGFTIHGNVTVKGALTIVDSTLDTTDCGGIDGQLIVKGGSVNIAAGNYTADVTSYLEDGYYFKNGVVSTGCYTLDTDGDDLNIYLGTDYLSLDLSATKVMALDLAFKLVMNYYGCSELVLDGNTLYGIELLDITDSLRNPTVLLNKVLGCIDGPGISNFATTFLKDVTDFGALADAIEYGTPVISYSMVNSAFNPHISYIPEDDSFGLNLTPADNKQFYNVNVYVSEDASEKLTNYMIRALREMDRVISFNALGVSMSDITYAGGFHMSGSAVADVVFDLTTNRYYPVIIGAILADSATGARRTELVSALNAYLQDEKTAPLQSALDKMSIAEAMKALDKTKNKSFASILKGLGLSASGAVELESLFTVARKALGAIIDYSGKTGTSHTLGGLKVAGTFSTYSFGVEKSADAYVKLTVKLIAEELAGCDHNYVADVTAPDCVNGGYTTYTCSICGDSYVSDYTDALGHDYVADVTGADCVNGGYTTYTCSRCGDSYVADYTGALGHDYVADVTAPDCVNGGYTTYTCSRCGDSYVSDYTDALGHTAGAAADCENAQVCTVCGTVLNPALGHDYQSDVTAPDCVNGGYTTYTCSRCGDSYVSDYTDALGHTAGAAADCENAQVCTVCGTVLNPALGHDYQSVVTAPDCVNGGYTTYTCSRCGDSYVGDYTDALGHDYQSVVTQPDCFSDGYTTHTCSRCGDSYVTDVVPALGHDYQSVVTAPDCVNGGYTTYTCSRCGDSYVIDHTSALGHDYQSVVTAPDCVNGGYTTYTCSRCGDSYVSDYTDALGHDFSIIVPGKAATCTEDGLTDGLKCSVCGEFKIPQEIIPAAHTPSDPGAYDKAPTCTEDGIAGASKCVICGADIDAGTIIPALGHTIVADPTIPSTCVSTGLKGRIYCAVCGEVFQEAEELPLGAHTPVVIPGKAPSCFESGLTEGFKCAVCGEILIPQETIAPQHTPEAYEKAPTCTEPGIAGGFVCTICGATIDAGTVIAPNGHKSELIPGTPADCVNSGLTDGYKCSVCGDILVAQQVIPATGHTIAVLPGTAADCANTGLTDGIYCVTCGEIFLAQTVIPAKGHIWVIKPAVAATCISTGLTEGKYCSVCGEVSVEQQVIDALPHTPVEDPAVEPTVDSTGLTKGSHCSVCGTIIDAQTVLAKLPYIGAPTVSTDSPEIIRGSKVDTKGKYLYLDGTPDGLTAENFSLVNFEVKNSVKTTIDVETNKKGLIANGAVVTVTAVNADGKTASVSYTIIIMGDANEDGKLTSQDTVVMTQAYIGQLNLSGNAMKAADMNGDGKLNSRDTVLASVKYVYWTTDDYASQI